MKILEVKNDSEKEFTEAASILKNGGLLAFPTETVYGLGTLIKNIESIRRIYEIKDRSFSKPLAIHAKNIDDARPFVKEIPPEALALIERFIPGPLMLVLEKSDLVPDIVTAGSRKVGIRVPSNDTFLKLSSHLDGVLVATSANKSGRFSAVNKEHVISELSDSIDGLLNNEDDIPLGIESTVVDFTVKPFRILRSGFINHRDISEVAGAEFLLSGDANLSRENKTSSNLRIIVLEADKDRLIPTMKKMYDKFELEYKGRVGLLVTAASEEHLGQRPNLKVMGSHSEPEVISRNFFACMRAFEKTEMEIVLVEGISREGVGWAIMDRLCSAATEVIKL